MEIEKIHNPSEFLKANLEVQRIDVDVKILEHQNKAVDGLVRINNHQVIIEFKQEINPQNITSVEAQLLQHTTGEYLMAMANYITPKAKELLVEKNINFLDRAGNMYLDIPGMLIRIDGNSNNSVISESYKTRAFSKSGGAVVFQFLMDPQLVNAPQRTIAKYAGVSLGTIPKVFEGLKKEGFLIRLNKKEFKLVEYEKLLNKWVGVLNDKILPANFIQNYKPATISAKMLLIDGYVNGNTQWGGEAAAALLTAYLTPEAYTIFTSNKEELLKKYKLVPAQNGEIAVYNKFWNHSDSNRDHVHPVLVYAQLMATGDSRNIETAEMILNADIRPNL
ncbi:MAG: hypothetical protein COB15_01365 [Flavobacteriales bacterium]|nr:MAG: hypothetical protein COB15_01365 [Flavobacteriales bacterium]